MEPTKATETPVEQENYVPPEPSKVVQLAPPITSGETKLTEEERLSIENLFLKMQNGQLQMQNLDNAKMQLVLQMRELQKEMDEKRVALSQKYGTDITRTTVGADGTILTTRPSAVRGA